MTTLTPKQVACLLAGMILTKSIPQRQSAERPNLFEFDTPNGKTLTIEVADDGARMSIPGAEDFTASESDIGFFLDVVVTQFASEDWLPTCQSQVLMDWLKHRAAVEWATMRQREMNLGYEAANDEAYDGV